MIRESGGELQTLEAQDLIAFERRYNGLLLAGLILPFVALVAFGPAALPSSLIMAAAIAGAWTLSWFLTQRFPTLVVRYQLVLRFLDLALIYVIIYTLHSFLHNTYYDAAYVLCVVAAAATHGRRGAVLLAVASGIAVEVGRWQLIRSGAMRFEMRHITDGLTYTIVFLITGLSVAFFIRMTAQIVQRREDIWRSAIAALAEGVVIMDAEGRVQSINGAGEEMFGLTASEAAGSLITMLLPSDGAGDGYGIWQARWLEDTACLGVLYETAGRRRNGDKFPLELSLSAMQLGPRRLFISTMRDITERRRANEALRFVAETSTILAASLDAPATLTQIARRAVPYLGDWAAVDELEEDGQISRLAVAHVDPAMDRYAREIQQRFPPLRDGSHPVTRTLRTGQAQLRNDVADETLDVMTRSAEHVEMVRQMGARSYMVVPMCTQGRTIGTLMFISAGERRYDPADLALAEDLALRAAAAVENARLYRQTQEAVRARDEFLSLISHEVRTPLTSVQLSLQGLLGSAREGALAKLPAERVVRMLEIAEWQSTRLSRLINDVMETAVITSGALSLEIDQVDLAATVRAVIADMEEELVRAGCPITLDASAPVIGRWDRARLALMAGHLLSNALKYGAGQPIEVSVTEGASIATLTVRDHGIGITPEGLPRIFQRFDRAVSTREYGGLGLGLYIVGQILNALGGEIAVTSQLGAGSTFAIMLPCEPTVRRTAQPVEGE